MDNKLTKKLKLIGIYTFVFYGIYGCSNFYPVKGLAKWWNTNSSKESKEKGVFVAYYDALPFEYSDSIFHVKLVFKEVYTEWNHWYDTRIDTAMENVCFYNNSETVKDQQLIAIFDTINSGMGYTGIVVRDTMYHYGKRCPYIYRRKYWDFLVGGDLWGNYTLSRYYYVWRTTGINMLCGEFEDTIRIPIHSLPYYDSICGIDKHVNFGDLIFVRRKDSIAKVKTALVKNKKITKERKLEGIINGYEYVDLGLSVKWATHNVGASRPEECGSYYAWGETEVKEFYTFDNCKTIPQEPENRWERVRNMDDIGGNEKYDVARAKWGSPWRLPSKEECDELKNKCKWEYITLDSIEGCKITGPNGKSIFLPCTDYINGKSLIKYRINNVPNIIDNGIYWTSQPDDNFYAYHLAFGKKGVMVKWGWCYYGIPVRPVFK